MAKKNQPIEIQKLKLKSGAKYDAEYADNRDDGQESVQANPNSLIEADAYYHVDEATQEVQTRVRMMLEKAKQVLTERQYNAFVLVDLKHLKLREAAKVMEINYSRVDQLVKKARLKLQKVYTERTNG